MKTNKSASNKKPEEVEHSLYQAIALIRDAEEAKQFFEDICTPAERQAIADRWHVVPHLKAGEAYREIYEETGVSITTIGRVARCMNFGMGGYNLIYKRLKKYENKKTKSRNTKKGALK